MQDVETNRGELTEQRRAQKGNIRQQRDVKVRDLYNFRSRSYWLRRLENHGRKERVMVEGSRPLVMAAASMRRLPSASWATVARPLH